MSTSVEIEAAVDGALNDVPEPQTPALMANQMDTRYADREVIHVLTYGDAGSHKSSLAASFPKPICVQFFDKFAKAGPYRRAGRRGPMITDDPTWGIDIEYVMSTREPDKAIIEIDYFNDAENLRGGPHTIYAAERFEHRFGDLFEEVRSGKWATVVLDSITFFEFAIRKLEQYKRNPISNQGNKQDARQWYARSAEGIEETCYAMADMRCNIVVCAHVREVQDVLRELLLWTPEAPGKKNRGLPAAFGEVYAMHYDAEVGTCIQSHRDESFIACTQINAPDGALPIYQKLWDNYKPMGED